jgi:hypothetical protein
MQNACMVLRESFCGSDFPGLSEGEAGLPQGATLHPLARTDPPAGGARRRRGGGRRTALAAFLAGLASVAGAAAAARTQDVPGGQSTTTQSTGTPDSIKHILVLPPVQWDAMGVARFPIGQQTASDLARVMGGLKFGLKPEQVSQHLPKLGAELHWTDLPVAKEFHADVRFLRMPMQQAGELSAPVTACAGASSYVALQFHDGVLFQVSWRFLPDRNCPDPRDAADQLYAVYVPLPATVATSTHYRTGPVEVVDVTDPDAGPLAAQRLQAGGE